ncbi:methionine--tRNA ligase [[Mycoplasma] mobile]|uniref:Methionine--tRNA ligase n=1 Tax=Mycoplasma mobile (strain ATCC 43663 / 163K / NCTC 11711) TaxID=267748 RepID=Q6KHX5_MYCM1|nr:methionine--tRNA ligase [[Mycoplasma] mobile]AAT27801.1 methionyl-tRNA synthetase [Mycoplasma mobile 163K]
MKKFYISTPIFYPNGDLHLGHLYSMSIAWAIRNYKKLKGYQTLLLTGSDEHGQKIMQSAEKNNLSPKNFVDQQAEKFKSFWKKFDIEYDVFVRTTDKKHNSVIEKILTKLNENNFIYKSFYEGLYSISDEEFLTKTQAKEVNGKFFHPVSNHELKIVKEESYFLKISQFQNWLKKYLEDYPNFISSQKVINELKSTFLNEKLEDLSISRNSFDWGIKFSFDNKHIAYVWVDALFSYLSPLELFLNQEKFNSSWNDDVEKIHVVGKEITRFHGIYWPIMLKMLNLPLPNKILSHGWLITSTGKMSKSKGNIVNPLDLLEEFDSETIKLYLLSAFSINRDGVFDKENIKFFYNSFLANNYGNLISRVSSLFSQNFSSKISWDQNSLDKIDYSILDKIEKSKEDFMSNFDNFEIDKAVEILIKLGNELNGYVDLTKAWLLKDDKKRLATILLILINGIYAMSAYLKIFMPLKIEKIERDFFQQNASLENIENWKKFDDIFIKKIESIFNRIK